MEENKKSEACDLAMEAFQRIINVIILALGSVLIILGEGCITYVKSQDSLDQALQKHVADY